MGATAGILLGVCAVTSLAMFPEESEQTYGVLQREIGRFRLSVLSEVPQITLGASGGVRELDACDGTFTEMLSYATGELPAVWAAHNNCGGDVVLPWRLGQRVEVLRGGEGHLYEVVDIRVTPKTWATTDDLRGLGGELALQSCFYGENRMRFLGLDRVDPQAPQSSSGSLSG